MMSLMNLLQSEDPAVQNGLLNFGLALMRSKGNFGNAVGQAGVAGQLGARDYRQQQALMSRTSLNDELLRNQLEQQQRMLAMQKLPQQFIKPPSAPGVDATGGMETAMENPNNAASAGGFDMGGYINALAGMDPIAALNLRNSMQKQAPQPIKLGEGDQLLDPTTYKPVASNPKAVKPADLPNAVQEYQFAQSQGYKGTFNDWVTSKARAGASQMNNYSTTPVATVGPDGKPAWMVLDKSGNTKILGGVQPPPNPAEVKRAEESKQAKQVAADKASMAYQTIDKMLKHPGLDTTIGISGQIDPRNKIWGTDAQGARALVEQAQGQAFLQAFESLKGGGQITQIEGEKATAAMARLQRAQKADDFKAAAKELQDIAAKAYERATGQTLAPASVMPDASAIDAELRRRGR